MVTGRGESLLTYCSKPLLRIERVPIHGRAALDQLPESLDVIYVLNANPQGEIQTSLPPSIAGRQESSRYCHVGIDWYCQRCT